jgi:hypothetical protein
MNDNAHYNIYSFITFVCFCWYRRHPEIHTCVHEVANTLCNTCPHIIVSISVRVAQARMTPLEQLRHLHEALGTGGLLTVPEHDELYETTLASRGVTRNARAHAEQKRAVQRRRRQTNGSTHLHGTSAAAANSPAIVEPDVAPPAVPQQHRAANVPNASSTTANAMAAATAPAPAPAPPPATATATAAATATATTPGKKSSQPIPAVPGMTTTQIRRALSRTRRAYQLQTPNNPMFMCDQIHQSKDIATFSTEYTYGQHMKRHLKPRMAQASLMNHVVSQSYEQAFKDAVRQCLNDIETERQQRSELMHPSLPISHSLGQQPPSIDCSADALALCADAIPKPCLQSAVKTGKPPRKRQRRALTA